MTILRHQNELCASYLSQCCLPQRPHATYRGQFHRLAGCTCSLMWNLATWLSFIIGCAAQSQACILGANLDAAGDPRGVYKSVHPLELDSSQVSRPFDSSTHLLTASKPGNESMVGSIQTQEQDRIDDFRPDGTSDRTAPEARGPQARTIARRVV